MKLLLGGRVALDNGSFGQILELTQYRIAYSVRDQLWYTAATESMLELVRLTTRKRYIIPFIGERSFWTVHAGR
jgi:hypothetical protein